METRKTIAAFAEWTLDIQRQELRDPDGRIVGIGPGGLALLRLFLDHPRQALTRDQIIELSSLGVPGPDFYRAVDLRVGSLRSLLDEMSRPATDQLVEKRLIKVVKTVGYMLDADVVWREDTPLAG